MNETGTRTSQVHDGGGDLHRQGGCSIGSMAGELNDTDTDTDPDRRAELARGFDR